MIHTANYGFRDLERRSAPNVDTSWLICSMTKAFTASMIGLMVEEGKFSLTTQLQEIFPDYQRRDAQANVTIADLLSHRTGLAPYDGLWLSSDNRVLMNRSQAIPIFSYAPVAKPLRANFLYNNIAYEILGQILEKVSNSTYLDLFHQRITKPLNLSRTFYAEDSFDNNTAKSYAALSDGSSYELPPWGHGKDLFIGAGGAIRSSIADLLIVYKAMMDAADSQVADTAIISKHNPFKLMLQLFEVKIGLPNQSLREYSYAWGWMRAQLPNIVDMFADYEPLVLGQGAASRLMIHHSGYIAGNVGYVALFPETSTAIVVLGNSAGFTDTMRLAAHMLVETVFENDFSTETCLEIARSAGRDNIQYVTDVHQDLLDSRTSCSPAHSLSAYTGRYYNTIGNFFIEIKQVGQRLHVAYMGAAVDTFVLETYQTDSFFWWLDYDESAKRARLPGYPKEYFILKFGCPTSPSWWVLGTYVLMQCLTWKHEFKLPGEGEVFLGNASAQLSIGDTNQHALGGLR